MVGNRVPDRLRPSKEPVFQILCEDAHRLSEDRIRKTVARVQKGPDGAGVFPVSNGDGADVLFLFPLPEDAFLQQL